MSYRDTTANKQRLTFDNLIGQMRSVFGGLTDERTGSNTVYTMVDAALGGFAVFFTQSSSFLEFQRDMDLAKGRSNASTLFNMTEIPSDNHIRDLLDRVSPKELSPLFAHIMDGVYGLDCLESYRSINGTLLVPMDGTQYFSSTKIHCENCAVKNLKNGKTNYSHTAVTPVIVAPGRSVVFPLEPEFVTPQDGHDKQDCENAAAKRWLAQHGSRYRDWRITILGDDLYSKQPVCEAIVRQGMSFILVCKPDSHPTLYKTVAELEPTGGVENLTVTRLKGKQFDTDTYRFVNRVPLRDGKDALMVNWCELTTRNSSEEIIYKNAFTTDHEISKDNVAQIIRDGRARWKVENENNNTLKTKGYHLTHNFGHGKKNLSAVMATLNILAFLTHSVLGLMDTNYQLVRQKLVTRKRFFNDIRALTCYLCFDSWTALLLFMMRGLEIAPPDSS